MKNIAGTVRTFAWDLSRRCPCSAPRPTTLPGRSRCPGGPRDVADPL